MNDKQVKAQVRDMRIWISMILRSGVLLSSALILAGGVLFLIQHPHEVPSFKTFSGQPDRLKHTGIIFNEALQLRSRSVIQMGVLVLLATPVLRVIFSLIEFLIHKDWIYVVITLVVLIVLFYSLAGV